MFSVNYSVVNSQPVKMWGSVEVLVEAARPRDSARWAWSPWMGGWNVGWYGLYYCKSDVTGKV